ncbi:MAG: adenylate/guanylate cyclase domain-containing protein [Acidimicrobiia bacterium]
MPPPSPETPDDARRVGADAVNWLRRSVGERIVALLARDPERRDRAVELGLLSRDWLEHPGDEPFTTAGPTDVAERLLERTVEQRPSTLAALGLSAIQVLTAWADDTTGKATPDVLTVAFTDLEGFTRYTARHGDDAASRLLHELQRIGGPIVRSRGGRVVKSLGDGHLLTFPNPQAGILAGLELIDAQPSPLRLRIGMHHGEVHVQRDRDVVGHVVNVAARVTEAAHGDEILATAAVRDEVGDLPGVSFGRMRRRTIKGSGEIVRVCRIRRAP